MSKGKVPLAAAALLAEWLAGKLQPHCMRIDIAGSIRREKSEVGDIELLYVPRWEQAGRVSLFGDSEGRADPVDRVVEEMIQAGLLEKRMNSAGHPIGCGEKNKALLHVASGVGIDLFSTDEANWGMAMVVRTGPAEWNVEMMSAFRRLGMEGHAYGGVTKGLRNSECPTEESVFDLLGLPWVPPQERTVEALRPVGRVGVGQR